MAEEIKNVNDKIDEADVTHIVSRVQDVVNQSIESLNMVMEQLLIITHIIIFRLDILKIRIYS
jgi:hypothetical protein